MNYRERGGLQNGGGSEVLPLRKGDGNVLAMLKEGGGAQFWGSFNTGG